MLISLILIGIVSSQIEIQGGKCLSVPIMPDFDLSKYSGTWYGQIRYPFRLDKPTDKCGSAEYTGINDTAIIANNTIIKLDEEGLYFKNEYIGTGVQLEVFDEKDTQVLINEFFSARNFSKQFICLYCKL